MLKKQQTTPNTSKRQATLMARGEQPTIIPPQLSQLSVEELNNVTGGGGVGEGGTGPIDKTQIA